MIQNQNFLKMTNFTTMTYISSSCAQRTILIYFSVFFLSSLEANVYLCVLATSKLKDMLHYTQ